MYSIHSNQSINELNIARRTLSATTTRREQVEVFVDGTPVQIEAGSAVIQACEAAGKDVSVIRVILLQLTHPFNSRRFLVSVIMVCLFKRND